MWILYLGLSVGAGGAAGVVAHAVRAAGVLQGAAVHVAAADLRLAVPVGKLHQVEEPDRIPGGEVVQRPLAALVSCSGSELRPGLVGLGRGAGLGGVSADGVVAAHVLPGAGMLGEAVLGFVGDVEVTVVAALDDLKPELRDIDHRVVTGTAEAALPPLVGHGIVDDVVLLHVLPRRVAVEGGAAGAGPDCRGGLCGDVHGNVVVGVVALGQAGQGGGWLGAVPGDAEDGGEGFDIYHS